MISNLKNKLQLLAPGHHGCFFFYNEKDAIETTQIFLQIGLDRDERCVYLADPSTIAKARIAFTRAGIDVDKETKRGALVLMSERDYLVNGRFDQDRMIQFIDQARKDALQAGFTGLRGAADVVWELGADMDLVQFAKYEHALDDHFDNKPLTLLCEYNLKAIPLEHLRAPLFSHSAVVQENDVCVDNHFHNSIYDFPRTSFDAMCNSLRNP